MSQTTNVPEPAVSYKKIKVTNLPGNFNSQAFSDLCSKYGRLVSHELVKKKESSVGYAAYIHTDDAQFAVYKLKNKLVGGKELKAFGYPITEKDFEEEERRAEKKNSTSGPKLFNPQQKKKTKPKTGGSLRFLTPINPTSGENGEFVQIGMSIPAAPPKKQFKKRNPNGQANGNQGNQGAKFQGQGNKGQGNQRQGQGKQGTKTQGQGKPKTQGTQPAKAAQDPVPEQVSQEQPTQQTQVNQAPKTQGQGNQGKGQQGNQGAKNQGNQGAKQVQGAKKQTPKTQGQGNQGAKNQGNQGAKNQGNQGQGNQVKKQNGNAQGNQGAKNQAPKTQGQGNQGKGQQKKPKYQLKNQPGVHTIQPDEDVLANSPPLTYYEVTVKNTTTNEVVLTLLRRQDELDKPIILRQEITF